MVTMIGPLATRSLGRNADIGQQAGVQHSVPLSLRLVECNPCKTIKMPQQAFIVDLCCPNGFNLLAGVTMIIIDLIETWKQIGLLHSSNHNVYQCCDMMHKPANCKKTYGPSCVQRR